MSITSRSTIRCWSKAYAPFYWYPPGYVIGAAVIRFGVGFAVGVALWCHYNWGWHGGWHGGGPVTINVVNYNRFNRTNFVAERGGFANWHFDAAHRQYWIPERDAAPAIRRAEQQGTQRGTPGQFHGNLQGNVQGETLQGNQSPGGTGSNTKFNTNANVNTNRHVNTNPNVNTNANVK